MADQIALTAVLGLIAAGLFWLNIKVGNARREEEQNDTDRNNPG